MISPYEDATEIYVVPPLQPDVAIVHAQRADAERRHADLGAARLPEGGRVRRRPRDRGVRGDGGGVGDPPRPEPHRDPRRRSSTPWSRSRSRAIPRSRRATTTATTRSTWSGMRSRRDADDAGRVARRVGVRPGEPREYVEKIGDALLGLAAARAGPVGRGRLRAVRVSARRDLGYSKSEIMIAASARQLGGVRNCFVGVGLPNIVCNLAQRTVVAGPAAGVRIGRVRRATRAAAAVDRRPDARDRARPPSRRCSSCSRTTCRRGPDRRGVPGRGADRPVRQHQHDRDRRLRPPEGPPARLGRGVRDRDQRAAGHGDHAAGEAVVRGHDGLPHVARAQRGSGARRRARMVGQRTRRAW